MKKLNFGCGDKILDDFDNVDYNNFDFNIFPYPIKDKTYDYILASHVLEHLDNWIEAFDELHRIAKPNAIIEVEVPFYNSMNAHYPTHKHVFTPASFDIWECWETKQDLIITKGKRIFVKKKKYNPLGKWIPFEQNIKYIIKVIK